MYCQERTQFTWTLNFNIMFLYEVDHKYIN